MNFTCMAVIHIIDLDVFQCDLVSRIEVDGMLNARNRELIQASVGFSVTVVGKSRMALFQ